VGKRGKEFLKCEPSATGSAAAQQRIAGLIDFEGHRSRWAFPLAMIPATRNLMRKFADRGVSFTDCLSSVLMKRAGLKRVFGFGRHFDSMGFQVWPGQAD